MSIRYYFSWFDTTLPEMLVKSLKNDIKAFESLVMISGQPSSFEEEETNLVKDSWLTPARITFKENHLIDYRKSKEEAKKLLEKASVIFLCGGYPIEQNQFLKEYQLMDLIKESPAIVIGASAGSINLSKKWLASKTTGMDTPEPILYDGVGRDDFFFCSKPQLTIHDSEMLRELSPLSETLDIYLAVNECGLRMEGNQRTVFGEVYLLRKGEIETLQTDFP